MTNSSRPHETRTALLELLEGFTPTQSDLSSRPQSLYPVGMSYDHDPQSSGSAGPRLGGRGRSEPPPEAAVAGSDVFRDPYREGNVEVAHAVASEVGQTFARDSQCGAWLCPGSDGD